MVTQKRSVAGKQQSLDDAKADARQVIERLGGRALTPAEGRRKLGLPARGERQLERRAAGQYA